MKPANLILLLGLAAAIETSTFSQVAALQNIAGGLTFPSNADATYGWRFSIDSAQPLAVTHLGLLDLDASGFAEEHRVGLWDSSDALLAEVTLAAGLTGTLQNGFRYLPLGTPAILQPGQSYSIGSWNLGTSDWAIGNATTLTEYAPEIDIIGAGYHPLSGFRPPKDPVGLTHGYFGPNLLFVPVPEPSEYMAVTAGALLLAAGARRFIQRGSLRRKCAP